MADDYLSSSDPTLQWIVDWFEQPGAYLLITLALPGMLVSGRIISAAEYFRGFGNLYIQATSEGTQRSNWDQFFGNLATAAEADLVRRTDLMSALKPDMPDEERQKILKATERRHIHLQEVLILASGGAPVRAPFWRGRLEQVVGWHFGMLNWPLAQPQG